MNPNHVKALLRRLDAVAQGVNYDEKALVEAPAALSALAKEDSSLAADAIAAQLLVNRITRGYDGSQQRFALQSLVMLLGQANEGLPADSRVSLVQDMGRDFILLQSLDRSSYWSEDLCTWLPLQEVEVFTVKEAIYIGHLTQSIEDAVAKAIQANTLAEQPGAPARSNRPRG